jgi:hypothetical protein
VLKKIIWLVGTARNAIVVILAASIAYGVDKDNVDYWKAGCPGSSPGKANCTTFSLTKIQDAAMPGFNMPQFTYSQGLYFQI